MNIPTEIIAAIISFLLAELGVFIGFIWKTNQVYQKDKEENLNFLNRLRAELDNKCNKLTMAMQDEVNARERCKVTHQLEVDTEITALKHKMEIEGQMNKRDIEELKEQVADISDKLDDTRDSISTVHLRIDKLFKMIESKKVTTTRNTKK